MSDRSLKPKYLQGQDLKLLTRSSKKKQNVTKSTILVARKVRFLQEDVTKEYFLFEFSWKCKMSVTKKIKNTTTQNYNLGAKFQIVFPGRRHKEEVENENIYILVAVNKCSKKLVARKGRRRMPKRRLNISKFFDFSQHAKKSRSTPCKNI